MDQSNDNIIRQFKTIDIIYFALGVGMLMAGAMFTFLVESGTVPVNPELSSVFQIVVPILAIGGFAAGKFLYSAFAKKSKEDTNEDNKIGQYRTAMLIVWALSEAPALFSGISYFMTGDRLFLAFFAMIFVGFILNRASISKFQQDFN